MACSSKGEWCARCGFESHHVTAELRANVGNSVLSIVMMTRDAKVHGVLKAMRKDRPIIPDVQLPVYFKPTIGVWRNW